MVKGADNQGKSSEDVVQGVGEVVGVWESARVLDDGPLQVPPDERGQGRVQNGA